MKLDRKTFRQLKSEQNKRKLFLAENLLANDTERAKTNGEWIELATSLLAPTEKRILLFYLTGIFVLLFGFLWLKTCTTEIRMEIESENFKMMLGEDWASERQSNDRHMTGDSFSVNNLLHAQGTPGLNLPAKDYPEEASASLDVKGDGIVLSRLILKKDANVEFNASDRVLKLFVKEKPVYGELLVEKADILLKTPEENIRKAVNAEISEVISFRSARTVGAPVEMRIKPGEDWQLDGLRSRKISFLEETRPDSGEFRSAIVSGKITLLETGTTREMEKGDNLILRIKTCRRLDISGSEKGIRVCFEGAMRQIKAGPQGFEKNLTLSLLEYLWHLEPLFIFFLALLSLWGKNFFLGD